MGPTGPDEPWFEALDRAWSMVLDPWTRSREPLTLLFSGGVDSGLLAWEFRDRGEVRLSTIGVVGSPDLAAGGEAARALGLPWHGTPVSTEEVLEVEHVLRDELEGGSATSNSVQVAMALAIRAAPPGALVCGQGADELFLGYAHFRGREDRALAERAHDDLDRLITNDWPRTIRIARRFGRSVTAPYLARPFVAAATRVPIDVRAPGAVPKRLFRAWARHRGLPASIADRPKRAFQFGSGVDRILARRRREVLGRRSMVI